MSNIRIDTYYNYYGIKKRVPLLRSTFKSIYIYKNLNGQVVDFKAQSNSKLDDAIDDAVSYLKLKKLKKEYILLFDGVNLIVSINANKDVIKKKYYNVLKNKQPEIASDLN